MQLRLDYDASVTQRQRKELGRLAEQQLLFPSIVVDADVSLHSPWEGLCHFAGDADTGRRWLERIVGPVEQLRGRKYLFDARKMDRLLYVRPPAKVTLDAACLAVGRALWARELGYAPLLVRKHRQRLLASSPLAPDRWPTGLEVRDVPWTAIATLAHLGVPLNVQDMAAAALLAEKLGENGGYLAEAGIAGSTVYISTTQPRVLEELGIPALAYAGPVTGGQYRLPVLAAEPLLHESSIHLADDARQTIKRLTGKVKPLELEGEFPWTLYPFQARDAAQGMRILESSGGVLFAGEMGSGKTTIALAVAHKLELWPLLVAAPLSAFSTWARQLGEMGKSFYLASDPTKVAWEKLATEPIPDAVIISYDRLHAFVELLETLEFKAIIADELQKTSSPGSRRSRALRQLAQSLPMRIGLSGTPMSNYLADLLPLGSFLIPGEWRARATSKDLSDVYPGDPVEAVAEHLGSMMVRRRMDDIGVTLPGKNVRRVFVQLTAEQRRALEALQQESEQEVAEGETDRMHVFAKLQKMRQIIACPSMAGVAGPNPKVQTAVRLAEEFAAMGRKSVLFCADRQTWRELGEGCKEAGLGWVGVWGSSSVADRLESERRYHNDPSVSVFIGTIQSCAEALTLSPTGTAWITTSYVYNPSTLAQAEARIYRLNQTNDVDIIYLHAQVPGGSLDDRFVEILDMKRTLISQVVDRREHVDTTQMHYSTGDLVWMLTGKRDERMDKLEADKKAVVEREQAKKSLAKATAHKRKYKNDVDVWHDDGSVAMALDEENLRKIPTQKVVDDVTFDDGGTDDVEDPSEEVKGT